MMKSLLILFLSLVVCAYGEQTGIVVDLSAALKPITDKMAAMGEMLKQLRQENIAIRKELAAQVKHLESCREKREVAFTAALGKEDSTGPYDKNLVFPKVLTNVGNAYSRSSGFFTAPLKGVYFFRFTVTDHLTSRFMAIMMFKNKEKIMYLSEFDRDNRRTYISSGATLVLNIGDKVNLRLPGGGHRLYDDNNNHCIFSGFLVFPL